MRAKAAKAALVTTIPVMSGYLFMGAAFGMLLSSRGYGFLWAMGMSVFIYAGSMQFVAVSLLIAPFDPLGAALMTLMVNARHIFYGVSLLEEFSADGKYKPYMVFALTDETYSLLCSAKAPEGADESAFRFFISLLDHLYWIIGSAAGSLAGRLITFDVSGLGFVMTALFVVIFIEQWKSAQDHKSALIGLFGSALCLAAFGPKSFILYSMALIACALMLGRKKEADG